MIYSFRKLRICYFNFEVQCRLMVSKLWYATYNYSERLAFTDIRIFIKTFDNPMKDKQTNKMERFLKTLGTNFLVTVQPSQFPVLVHCKIKPENLNFHQSLELCLTIVNQHNDKRGGHLQSIVCLHSTMAWHSPYNVLCADFSFYISYGWWDMHKHTVWHNLVYSDIPKSFSSVFSCFHVVSKHILRFMDKGFWEIARTKNCLQCIIILSSCDTSQTICSSFH